MELEVFGRHALLFDDDDMAAFVNSGDALVDWNSLQIDRYDVRHLLSGPLPPRRLRNPHQNSSLSDSSIMSELDRERYLDLPPSPDESEESEKAGDTGAYHAVAFSYENTDDSAGQNNADGGLERRKFHPSFSLPESLLHSLPPTEKVHQIIARTAMFVSERGGQAEIILRVKQGDNPTFGFLMPDHYLHPYFRFLVGNQEVLQSDTDGKTQSVDANVDRNQLGVGGALSLLGSVYGSGEDEDSIKECEQESENVASRKVTNASSSSMVSHVSENTESSTNATSKDEAAAKYPFHSKQKVSAVKKNPSIAASKAGRMSSVGKEAVSGSYSTSSERPEELLFLEPPYDLKILVGKVVDCVLKNGKQFEDSLREHDSKYGRFPFLIPSNQYHPFYLKALQNFQESKVGAKNSYGIDDLAQPGKNKKLPVYKEDDALSSKYIGFDGPCESDRKEKFKMVIGKSKKDLQDLPSKATQQEHGVSIDAEAAAAILQAAARGLKNSYPGIMSSSTSFNGNNLHQGSDMRQGSDFQQNSLVSDAKAIAKAAISPQTSTLGDFESHLTKELKLKAERLKRAKIFVAMLKSGAVPSKDELLHALPLESSEPGVLVNPTEVDRDIKGQCGNLATADFSTLEKNENGKTEYFRDEYTERRSRRKYRTRSERHDGNDEYNDEEEIEQKNSECGRQLSEEENNYKHSRKKHHSCYSSRENHTDSDDNKEKSRRRSRKRHRSHCCPHEDDDGKEHTKSSSHRHKKHSSHGCKHEEDDQKYRKRSRKKHRSHSSSHRSKHGAGQSKVHSSGEDSGLRKGDSSSGAHGHYDGYVEEEKASSALEREELEEGEISPKLSDQSKSVGGHVSRETSVDANSRNEGASFQSFEPTHISDDLRAKIRAMLMTTR